MTLPGDLKKALREELFKRWSGVRFGQGLPINLASYFDDHFDRAELGGAEMGWQPYTPGYITLANNIASVLSPYGRLWAVDERTYAITAFTCKFGTAPVTGARESIGIGGIDWNDAVILAIEDTNFRFKTVRRGYATNYELTWDDRYRNEMVEWWISWRPGLAELWRVMDGVMTKMAAINTNVPCVNIELHACNFDTLPTQTRLDIDFVIWLPLAYPERFGNLLYWRSGEVSVGSAGTVWAVDYIIPANRVLRIWDVYATGSAAGRGVIAWTGWSPYELWVGRFPAGGYAQKAYSKPPEIIGDGVHTFSLRLYADAAGTFSMSVIAEEEP